MQAIIRRIDKLERQLPVPVRVLPPFAWPEIQALVERLLGGGSLQGDEFERLQRYSPIVERNVRIYLISGVIHVKRILGVDHEEI